MAIHLTDLEQSKNLKAWGAPQDTYWGWEQLPSGDAHLHPVPVWPDLSDWTKTYTHIPIAAYDLESLIGWLGDEFFQLCHSPEKDMFWVDQSYNVKTKKKGLRAFGNTTLEAVFALAEAIHGKEGK